MVRFCEECRSLHSETELCPKYKEMFKKHPEWFNEMVQTVVTANASSEIVQRYGSAVKEHIVAYSGVDNQNGQHLTRSLESISEQKTAPGYEYQSLKQRAGFSAEVQETARANAERIINSDKTRVVRTDDIGMVNDPLYDLVEMDAMGNVIDGSGVQMKFVGATPTQCWEKIVSPKFQKYIDANTPIQIPSDYYSETLKAATKQIEELNRQRFNLMANGEIEKANLIKQRIDYCEKTRKLIKESHVSSKEAMYAVKNPGKYTAGEIIKTAHNAGVQGLQQGVLIGGGISIIRNVVLLKNGDIKADIAVKSILKDTAKGAAGGYIVSGGGAALKGMMQNSASEAIQGLSQTQFPSSVVGLAYGIGKSSVTNFIKYKDGKITKEEMNKSFTKDAVKGTLINCSLAMITFPAGLPGIAATMGVAMYLDAACTNLLDEVFGDGLYGEILNSCGHITAVAENSVELLTEFKDNVHSAEQYHRASEKTLSEIKNNRASIENEKEKTRKLLEEL